MNEKLECRKLLKLKYVQLLLAKAELSADAEITHALKIGSGTLSVLLITKLVDVMIKHTAFTAVEYIMTVAVLLLTASALWFHVVQSRYKARVGFINDIIAYRLDKSDGK